MCEKPRLVWLCIGKLSMKKTHLTVVNTKGRQRSAPGSEAKHAISKPEFFAALKFIKLSSKEIEVMQAYFFRDADLALSEAGEKCGMTKQGFDYKVKRVLSTVEKFRAALSLYEEYQHLNQNEP
jgi:predicted DNA-binding protein YlxM (UPF0122 family)